MLTSVALGAEELLYVSSSQGLNFGALRQHRHAFVHPGLEQQQAAAVGCASMSQLLKSKLRGALQQHSDALTQHVTDFGFSSWISQSGAEQHC